MLALTGALDVDQALHLTKGAERKRNVSCARRNQLFILLVGGAPGVPIESKKQPRKASRIQEKREKPPFPKAVQWNNKDG